MQRQFRATRPNELWIVDFTYVPTWSHMAFTAFVTDVFSRRIVGWRTSSSMPTDLPLDTLEMALWTRDRDGQPVRGVVHHSDAGSQGELNAAVEAGVSSPVATSSWSPRVRNLTRAPISPTQQSRCVTRLVCA